MRQLARERSDEELLRDSRADAEAFAVFYRRHVHQIARYLRRRLSSDELAADLTAEVFAAALVARRRYRPEKATAQAWLYGIAAHKLADAHRAQGAERRARDKLGMPDRASPDEALERIEACDDRALRQLEELPATHREAVLAFVVHEEPYADIARRTGVSESLIRQRVSRGLRHLRRTLQEPAA